jgi:hypothetical protein
MLQLPPFAHGLKGRRVFVRPIYGLTKSPQRENQSSQTAIAFFRPEIQSKTASQFKDLKLVDKNQERGSLSNDRMQRDAACGLDFFSFRRDRHSATLCRWQIANVRSNRQTQRGSALDAVIEASAFVGATAQRRGVANIPERI